MKKFRLCLSLILAFVAVFTLVGCKKAKKANFVVPEGGYDGSEVTITFYHTMSAQNLQPVLETYIAEFNKIYPNIHINHKSIGGYDDVRDQIQKEITVDGQPNIAYCYPDHVALYNLASLKPI